MLDKVRVLNDHAIDRTFVLNELYNGAKILNISGLGPVKAELNTTQRVNGEGVNFNSRNIGSRNIVFSLSMAAVGVKSVEEIRFEMYDCFPVGEEVELRFESSGKVYQIYGIVESVSPEIFTRAPSLQVSIICTEPYFLDYPGTENVVTLPYADTPVTIPFAGRLSVGVTLEVEAIDMFRLDSTMGHFQLTQTISGFPNRGFRIYDWDLYGVTDGVIGRFTRGDVIKITSNQGKKSATVTRAGVTYNIFGALKDDNGYYLTLNQWPLLVAGRQNAFSYQTDVYESSHLSVKVSWDMLVSGL